MEENTPPAPEKPKKQFAPAFSENVIPKKKDPSFTAVLGDRFTPAEKELIVSRMERAKKKHPRKITDFRTYLLRISEYAVEASLGQF